MPPPNLSTQASDIQPPRCAMCRTRMEFKRREIGVWAGEKLTFQCPKCEFIKTKLGGDASKVRRPRASSKKSRKPSVS